MTKKKKKKQRIKLGDVCAIPLPNGKYAFGRVFRDACIAIYQHIGKSPADLPPTEDYQFTVGIYQYALKSGLWPIVDKRPFESEEAGWPPPNCVIDTISGGYSIYHYGEFRESSKKECAGLETAAVWEPEHIVDRIMGDDKWHRE